ncbi:hypothetical protein A2U01_0046824 [Trifolium medium]|uniref:Uncharacterized protein n=1 Tax=Trifolium medium TaxID=97028 RepID=A0A392QMJ8_9FABA|nr:hypothetical protein [Trifolium medium]
MLMIFEASQENNMVTGKRGDQENTLKTNLCRGQEKIMIGSKITDRIEIILIDLNQKEDTNLNEEKKRGPEGNDNFEVWVYRRQE